MKNSKKSLNLSCTFPKVFLFFLFTAFTFIAQSQQLWFTETPDKYIGIELLKPSFENIEDISFFTSKQVISGKFRVSESLSILAELPFAHFGGEDIDSEFAFGNPYLGVEFRKPDQPHLVEAGLRPPTAPDDKFGASLTGIFSDFDRAESFATDLLSFALKYNYVQTTSSNVLLRFRAGPSIWIPTDGDDGNDTEVLMDYSAQAGYDGSTIQVLGGFTGRLTMTEDDGSIGDRTVHQFGVSSHYKANNVQPGILLRFPLDSDLSDIVNFVFGINLIIDIN